MSPGLPSLLAPWLLPWAILLSLKPTWSGSDFLKLMLPVTPMTSQTLLTTLLGALELLPCGRCVLVPQFSALFLLKHCVVQAPSCVQVPIPSCWSSGFHHTLLLLLLSRFSRVRLSATPLMAAHQAPPSLGFSRQEHWSGLPSPSPPLHAAHTHISHSSPLLPPGLRVSPHHPQISTSQMNTPVF